MARPYSNDLRERVVGSVGRDGLSRRQAASRYGVGVTTAIRWVQRRQRTGSGRWRRWLLRRCRGGDFTLVVW